MVQYCVSKIFCHHIDIYSTFAIKKIMMLQEGEFNNLVL